MINKISNLPYHREKCLFSACAGRVLTVNHEELELRFLSAFYPVAELVAENKYKAFFKKKILEYY